MVKVGDKIRILFDGADHANVQRGDEFVVSEVFDGEYVEVEGEYHWLFSSYVYEVIPAEPPQKITQNGYEYELAGPVKPDWLVDGAWVVSRITGQLYKVKQVGRNQFQAIKDDGFNNSGNLTADEFYSAYRPHTASDWKWGDWAMYEGKRVFVVGGVDNAGRIFVSYPDIYPLGRNDADRNFLFVPSTKLTPTF